MGRFQMNRSLFINFFARLILAMALILAVRQWLLHGGWILPVLCILGFASLNAWLLARSVRRSILPLQRAAGRLARTAGGEAEAGQETEPAGAGFRDFDGLGRSLARASVEVERALAAAAGSRDELAAIMDSLQDAVVAVDAAGRILWANQRLRRLVPTLATGMVRTGHSLVQTIRDPEVLACVRTALEQRAFCQRRTTLLVPGGIVEVNASPIPSGGAVALLHDITRLEAVERAQRDFVANVSHELRTPLTSISGYVETLLDHETGISPQGRSFLETILKNSNRMNRLTEDLLTLARVESAEKLLQPVPTSVRTLVRDAVQGVSGLVRETDAMVEVGAVPEVEVRADPDAAIQVLTNLVENAIKYGRSRQTGLARVRLEARVVDDEMMVEFAVQDFGPGIASEHLPRLFERFYRVDKARSQETGGTGLGLAIARYMVRSMGGEIRAESELNAGSLFLFTLPREPMDELEPEKD